MFRPRPLLAGAAALCALAAGGTLIAQIEGGDRGVPPIDSSTNYEVTGVVVDVSGKDADAARVGGWRQAQRKGWRMLYARAHGIPLAQAPGLPDGTLDSIVAGIVVEEEQIGPRRYIARLGVLFDRARAGRLLGGQGQVTRSAPMLVIPILWQGGQPISLERRNPWQEAWARFRAGGSPVDYVRAVGTGADPLVLNVAQARRPGRTWWRMLLEQYGAADVVVPEVNLRRLYPGGPVLAVFTARHGPDGRIVGRFELRADTSEGIPRLLDQGIQRIDELYAGELRAGGLRPDPSLIEPEEELDPDLLEGSLAEDGTAETLTLTGAPYTLQVETPDAASLSGAEATIRSIPGVSTSTTQSLALGGVSVIRIVYQGDQDGLRIALQARGFQVSDAGGALRVRRAVAPAPASSPAPPPPAPK